MLVGIYNVSFCLFILISSGEQEFIYDYCQGDIKDKLDTCNKH